MNIFNMYAVPRLMSAYGTLKGGNKYETIYNSCTGEEIKHDGCHERTLEGGLVAGPELGNFASFTIKGELGRSCTKCPPNWNEKCSVYGRILAEFCVGPKWLRLCYTKTIFGWQE